MFLKIRVHIHLRTSTSILLNAFLCLVTSIEFKLFLRFRDAALVAFTMLIYRTFQNSEAVVGMISSKVIILNIELAVARLENLFLSEENLPVQIQPPIYFFFAAIHITYTKYQMNERYPNGI